MKKLNVIVFILFLCPSLLLAGGMSEVDLLTREGISEYLYQSFATEVDTYDQISGLRFSSSSEGCFFQTEAAVRLNSATDLNCEVCFQGETRNFWVGQVTCY